MRAAAAAGTVAGDVGAAWLSAMRAGDFAAAWRISDGVLAGRDPATRDDPALPYHLRWVWDGRALAGRRVLVRCYHGLGDSIQFARYLPHLARVARHVTAEVQPELLPLFRGLAGVDRWIAFDPAHPAPPDEVDIEIMELAHALRLPPDPAPYLHVPGVPAGFRVGLCWQAGGWDPARSVPVGLLRPVLDGWPAVSLQRGAAAEDVLRADAPAVLNPHDRSLDVRHSAELLAACGAVLTVDTMVAHLAGALGRPTAVLLRADADWRWPTRPIMGRDGTPWYGSVRMFRQDVAGCWDAPLAAARAWLTRASLCHPGASD